VNSDVLRFSQNDYYLLTQNYLIDLCSDMIYILPAIG
jgi:hypothetical protein